MKVKVMKYNIHNDVIWCIQIWDLEILGQGHRVQHLQQSQLMENINLYKSRKSVFIASYHGFLDIHISKIVTLKI